MRPLRSYSRFSFVKEWRKSISSSSKHRRTKVTSPTDSATGTLYYLFVHVFSVILTVSKLFAIFVRLYTKGGIPFLVDGSIAEQNDVANRFDDRDFILAVCNVFFVDAAISKLFAIFVR
jgi:hypothetical protein